LAPALGCGTVIVRPAEVGELAPLIAAAAEVGSRRRRRPRSSTRPALTAAPQIGELAQAFAAAPKLGELAPRWQRSSTMSGEMAPTLAAAAEVGKLATVITAAAEVEHPGEAVVRRVDGEQQLAAEDSARGRT
jgi:hypothetical protein